MSISTQITVAATAETIIVTAPGALRGPMGDVTPEVEALVDRAELGASQASTSAGQAASSAAQAGDSAAAASGSAGSASSSAAEASEDALAAEVSKAAAGQSELAAEQSAADAAASASAAGRFIMASSVAPTQRTNNTPLQVADEWQDTVNNLRMSWTGSAWVALNSSAQQLEERLANQNTGGGMLRLPPISGALGRTIGQIIAGLKLYQEYGADAFDSNAIRTLTKEIGLSPQGIAGGIFSINSPLSTVSLIDFANFAGQLLGTLAPNGVVIHHYTDGTLLRLDNVGAGATIRSHMARNASRRPDKPADYIGTGNHLQFSSEAGSLYNFFMTPNLDAVWQNKGSSFISGAKSSEGGGFCHTFTGYGFQPLHTAFMASANRMLYVGEHAADGRAQITSERAQGLEIRAENGLLRLKTIPGGSVILNNGDQGYIQNQGTGKTKIEGGTADKSVSILGPLQLKRYPLLADIPLLQTPNDRTLVWQDDVAMLVQWNSVRWTDLNGFTPAKHSGTTALRPALTSGGASADIGFNYFDSTLGRPIWWNGSAWVDSLGVIS